MHGLLGSKTNWKGLVQKDQISLKRNSYCVELRNHPASDHHSEMNYEVISDDILRFSDNLQLEKFTVLGHSLGGRSAMSFACRYPDRVDGCISVDSAPVDESKNMKFREFTYGVLKFMYDLEL